MNTLIDTSTAAQDPSLNRDQELTALMERASHQPGNVTTKDGRKWEHSVKQVTVKLEVTEDEYGNDWTYIATIASGEQAYQAVLNGDEAVRFTQLAEGNFVTVTDPGKYQQLIGGFIDQLRVSIDDAMLNTDETAAQHPVVALIGRLARRPSTDTI